MNQPQFFIVRAVAVRPGRLLLSFADGYAAEVDLTHVIDTHPTLARLSDFDVFCQVGPDEWSRGVTFANDDDLTLASDNLRAMAIEQSGQYSHQQLLSWMEYHNLTLDEAAEALGLSRRMLAYYRSGEKPIPKTVGLAMLGWEIVEKSGASSTNDAFEWAKAA